MLKDKVAEAFRNALENGYDLLATMTDAEIVTDMMSYDADLESEDEDKVLAEVKAYREENA